MRISTLDGIFATIHGNLTGGVIFTSFLIALGAQKFHFALVNAVSSLAQLVQVFSAFWVTRLSSRKLVVVLSALLSRLILCAIVLLPYLLPLPTVLKVVIGAAFLWGAFGSIAANAWTGWMSDLVPRRIRGRYFSSRNFALMLASIASSLAASWFLDQFSVEPPKGLLSLLPDLRGWLVFLPENKMHAFAFLYLLGVLPAIVSAILVYRQFEPVREETLRAGTQHFFASLREPFAHKTFVSFLLFSSIFSLVNSLAGPYWTPFCLEDLQMPYLTLAVCGLTASLSALVSVKLWGRLCDRFGNRPVVVAAMFVTSFHPLLYLVSSKDFLLPIYIDFASSGAMWTGYGIAMNNILLQMGAARSKEVFYATYATILALVIFSGSLFSGYIVDYIPELSVGPFRWNSVQVIFLVTSVMRFACLPLAGRMILEKHARSALYMLRSLLTRRKDRG